MRLTPPLRPALVLILAAGVLAVHAAAASAPAPPAAPQAPATVLATWTMREDAAGAGLARGWARGGFAGRSVAVPDVLHPGLYTGRGGAANYEGSVAWYRTRLDVPADGVYELRFASANFSATVWVDGHRLGIHRGSYLPFALRARLGAGEHVVVVRVDWRDPAGQSREGFHRTWFNWGGLDGRVEVVRLGAGELLEPSLQTSLGASGEASVRIAVTVVNDGPARSLTPEGTLSRDGQSVALRFATVTLGPGARERVTAVASVEHPALWSPSSPSLYRLTVRAGGGAVDARVGLRQLSWHGGRLYLNGRRLLLHGATIQQDADGHGDALTPADEARIVSELKAIGANVARAQHPLDEALLDRLDEAGILVWQGIGPVEGAGQWYSYTPALLAAAVAQARTGALAEQLHPAVIAWNLVDEVAGNGRDGAEVAYVRSMTRWLHAHDPGRMVAVDVWGDHPPLRPGALFSDVDAVAETDYSGWYDSPGASPARVQAMMRARLGAMERTFAGRVLLISEFGAESNALNRDPAPGSYAYQAQLIREHVAVYAGDPRLSGMMIWLLRDYPLTPTYDGGSIHAKLPAVRLIEGLNQKGLFTYSGVPKPAVATVRRLFGALAPG